MVAYDSGCNCRFCEYLSKIIFLKQVCSYRDDGLITNRDDPLSSCIQKKVSRASKSFSFNHKIVKFLDITFNIFNNTFKLHHKDNESPFDINVNSNNPHILTTVNARSNK